MISDSDRQQTTNLKQMTGGGNGLVRVGNISSAGGAGRGYCCACGPILCPGNCTSPNTLNMAGDFGKRRQELDMERLRQTISGDHAIKY